MFRFLMPDNWTSFAFRRPVTVFMILVSFILFGAVSYNLLPLELLPEKDNVWMNIWVPYPNSTPRENVRLIATHFEDEMKTLRGIRRVETYSGPQGVNVNLRFDFDTDMKVAYTEVRDRVERVRPLLPEEIDRIWIWKRSSNDIPILWLALAWDGSRDELYQVVDEQIRRRIERIKGVADIDVWGAASKRVVIDLDEDRVKAHHVDVGRLMTAIEQADADLPGGYIEEAGLRYVVRTAGAFRTVEDIENYAVNDRGLRLRDIARVSYRRPERRFVNRLNRRDAVGMAIRKESNANTVALCAAVRETLEELTHDPRWPGLTYYIFFDQSSWIRSSLDGIKNAGLWGGLFALAVLFFFLRRYRTTFIVAAAIPGSILVTLTAMYFLNRRFHILSLNIISLMGMMLAIGMLVDNAVVVLENIIRLRRRGMEAGKAAVQGAKDVSIAVTAATLTTAIVFLPLVFIDGGAAKTEMREIGLVIAIALASSLVMSLSFIPLLAARLLREDTLPEHRLLDGLERAYARSLHWVLSHRRDALILFGLLVALTMALPWQKVENQDEPADERQIYMHLHPPKSNDLAATTRFVDGLEARFLTKKDSLDIAAVRSDFNAHHVNITLFLVNRDKSTKTTKEVAEVVKEMIPKDPGLEVFARWGAKGSNDPRVSIALAGEDTHTLERIAEEVKLRLSRIPEITNIQTDLDTEDSEEEIRVAIDRVQAGKHNLTPQGIARVAFAGIRGRDLPRLRMNDREIRVWIQSEEADRQTLDQLKNQPLALSDGSQLPLATMANFTYGRTLGQVYRRDSRTVLIVRANTTSEGIKKLGGKISRNLKGMQLPRGYSWRLGDRWERLDQDTQGMQQAMLLAVAVVLLLLGALFESFIDPLIVFLVSLPFALIGAYWLLYLTGTNLTVLAMIGLVILIGVVVNNAIVFIDHVAHLRARGMQGRDLLVQAGRDRLRPILMTALTTTLGLLPMAFGNSGIGGLSYAPMGRAVMGGLIMATLGTLLALPLVYSGFEDMREMGRGIIARIRKKPQGRKEP